MPIAQLDLRRPKRRTSRPAGMNGSSSGASAGRIASPRPDNVSSNSAFARATFSTLPEQLEVHGADPR